MALDASRKDIERRAALNYHEFPRPGKLEVRPTKPMETARDLSRAYSPGVAEACTAIAADPALATRYTAKRNLVAVISNGTAVLGLGNIGALASKPVMEGKAVLFKKFAGIDCFDIEVDESDPEALADLVCRLEPTFGAVNLEDIKAPDCFTVERICRGRMGIPVFHDDQHGTAIVVAAAARNALRIAGKRPQDIRIVGLGAGAAGVACLAMLHKMGVPLENITVFDRSGVLHAAREDLAAEQMVFATAAEGITIDQAMRGADMFLGLSGPGALPADNVREMAGNPIIFALANPVPEIMPEEAREASPGAMIATGRSDYPNQVNNVLCFPFIFRGALDVEATEINDAMKLACVDAIASLARQTTSAEVGVAYEGERLTFGRDYLIPKPFDPRLLPTVAVAVARAAIESGVARRVLILEDYRQALEAEVFKSSMIMRGVFAAARESCRRIVFAEGEDDRVLRAVQAMSEDSTDRAVLVGRPNIIAQRIDRAGLSIVVGQDFETVNPENDERYREYWQTYHKVMRRHGVTPDLAKAIMRTNTTAIAATMVHRGDADSMICGTFGQYQWHLNYVTQMLSTPSLTPAGALSLVILDDGPLFVADTHVNIDQAPETLARTVVAAARHVRRFGLEPKIALCSGSQFGNLDSRSGRLMRGALGILDSAPRDFQYEGEMHTDAALDPDLRKRLLPGNRLEGRANVLIYADTDAAGAARNLLKSAAGGLEVGPILMGMGNRAHIVTPGVTSRGLLNIAALAGADVATYS
ncbi:malate dehydrogenase (oxaloacetate-decarboxylating)(NADP+) [Palleronia marisminoris]|uniref:NADP-dependent malic enzyme n=1 Tax=Palleronia marisminoris TaxID=315423 RepID=A0A1Y5SPB0_9RHOB|nr:NADP-dependent malic enzyme [Palleronia marisminoris]SFG93147.1 malate dehydrogenase (oxaloacetate-decarboxylating)(NADP+) [Palleronia marisminoris]SLN45290.1 NADP-dependent malic enzyme [Palleronia marisminoris]